jgi:hypothetical protein
VTQHDLSIHCIAYFIKIFLQEAFYVFLYLFATSTAAAPASNPDFGDKYLPSLRVSREEVQEMKEAQTHLPGYIHDYISLGGRSVPVVEADPDILLDDEDGHRARARSLPGACQSLTNAAGSCNLNYCWTDINNDVYTETLTITGSNGQSNPSNVASSNTAHLALDPRLNHGYNGWFGKNHECSNRDTVIYTDVYYNGAMNNVLSLNWLECDTCYYGSFVCNFGDTTLLNNIAIYTNGYQNVYSHCVVWND